MGSWVFDPAGVFEYWSRELFDIYGLDPAKGAPSLQDYLARVHPQDREFMSSLITQLVAEVRAVMSPSASCDQTVKGGTFAAWVLPSLRMARCKESSAPPWM